MFGKANDFSKGLLIGISPFEREIKSGEERTVIVMEVTAKPTFQRMPETKRGIKMAMNKGDRALGKGKFDLENRRSDRILFKELKIKLMY